MRSGSAWRPVAFALVVAAAGAAGTLAAGAAVGMHGSELLHLALLLLPALLATTVSVAAARPLLVRSSIRVRLAAVASIAAVTSAVSLVVLARQMFIDPHDTVTVVVLLAYSAAAGAAAALVIGRSSSDAVRRLSETSRAVGEGDLSARVGPLEADRELEALGATLDEMASRLERAVARVHEVEARRRDLVTAVSHDLRTPLASLRAMIEAIDEGVVDDGPTLRRYAAEMRRSVAALVALTDDLFELVQLEAGAIEAETERARVQDVVASALSACRAEAATKGLAVQTVLDGAADAACSPRMVRVLQNLLSNAIRHTPVDGTVRIEAQRDGERLRVSVEDTGEGIPAESLDRVFEPFWRADPSRTAAGAGLGLTLAKRIVEAMGGRIEVESRVARGTRFAVVVPDMGLRASPA
jgi:signal transduction histidine kinase